MLKKYSLFGAAFLLVFSCFFGKQKQENIGEGIKFPTAITTISSPYGTRELWGSSNFHNGIDFLVPQGNYVHSISYGVVTHVGFLVGYGNCVTILHNNGLKSLYAHLSEHFIVSLGEHITTSQIIGTVGPKYLSNGMLNGYTTGPHLHLSIFNQEGKTIDPLSLNFEKIP